MIFAGFSVKLVTMKSPLLKMFLLIILTFSLSQIIKAQQVYSSDSKYDADVKIYVVESKYDADLLVYKTESKYNATGNEGLWYFTENKYDADKKVFFTDSKYDADLLIYFTDSKYNASWRNKERIYLLY